MSLWLSDHWWQNYIQRYIQYEAFIWILFQLLINLELASHATDFCTQLLLSQYLCWQDVIERLGARAFLIYSWLSILMCLFLPYACNHCACGLDSFTAAADIISINITDTDQMPSCVPLCLLIDLPECQSRSWGKSRWNLVLGSVWSLSSPFILHPRLLSQTSPICIYCQHCYFSSPEADSGI